MVLQSPDQALSGVSDQDETQYVKRHDYQLEEMWRIAIRVIKGAESLLQDLTLLSLAEGRLGGDVTNFCEYLASRKEWEEGY